MKKYGEFAVFPIGKSDRFAIVAGGSISTYGKIIMVVHTAEKAWRLIKKYERKMGRIS